MERRKGNRYPVRLDCRLSFRGKPTVSVPGLTLNMSSGGVLVFVHQIQGLPARLPVGEAVGVTLELPKVPYFRCCSLFCHCRIVRIEEQDQGRVLAFQVKRHQFLPSPEGAAVLSA